MQRLQRHQHLDGRAVGVGDDAVRAVLRDGLRVDLGHHQRDVVLVAELRGVVDDDAAGGAAIGAYLRRHFAAGGEQADVGLREIEGLDVEHRPWTCR